MVPPRPGTRRCRCHLAAFSASRTDVGSSARRKRAMITVYGEGRGFRVVWLLEEMGLPYRQRPVDLIAGNVHGSRYSDDLRSGVRAKIKRIRLREAGASLCRKNHPARCLQARHGNMAGHKSLERHSFGPMTASGPELPRTFPPRMVASATT